MASGHYSYDAAGRPLRAWQTDSSGETRELALTYDAGSGYLRTVSDGSGAASRFTRDAFGRTETATVGWDLAGDAPGPDATVTSLRWDLTGNLTGLTPPGTPEHRMRYGVRGDLTAHDTPPADGEQQRTAWTRDGDDRGSQTRVGRYEDGDGDGVYDDLLPGVAEMPITSNYYPATAPPGSRGRLRSLTFPTDPDDVSASLATVDVTYYGQGTPGAGQVATLNSTDGPNLSYAWNGPLLTRETTLHSTGPVHVDYTYGGPGLAVSAVDVSAGADTYTTEYSHDGDGLLSGVGAARVLRGATELASLDVVRDPATGALDTTHLSGDADVRSDIDVDELGQLEKLEYTWLRGGQPQGLRFDYVYSLAGRISQVTETRTVDGVASVKVLDYAYDAAGRLETVTWDGVLAESYVYDDNGNRLAWTLDDDGPGPQPPVTRSAGTYDAQDRLLSYIDGGDTITFAYDQAGRLRSRTEGSATAGYRYDALGRLRRVELSDARVVTYEYDAQGRRVVRAIDGVVDTRWVYGGGTAPIAELDGAGAVRRRYAFAAGLFTPTVAGHASGATRYLVDHLGRPRVAVDAALGTVEMEVATDSFGRVTSGSAVARFGMGGGVWDPDTGLLHLGARDYTPELGRWLAPDPAGFGGGQANLYAYVGSNPISYVDPSGEVGVVVVIVFGVGILASIALNPNSAGDASPRIRSTHPSWRKPAEPGRRGRLSRRG